MACSGSSSDGKACLTADNRVLGDFRTIGHILIQRRGAVLGGAGLGTPWGGQAERHRVVHYDEDGGGIDWHRRGGDAPWANAGRTQDEDAALSLVLRATAFAAGISIRAEALTYGVRRGRWARGRCCGWDAGECMSHQDEDAEPSLVLRATAFAAGISTRGEALTYGIRRGKVGTGPVLRLGGGRMHVAPRAKMRSCL